MLTKEQCFTILDKYVKANPKEFWQTSLQNVDYNRFSTPFQVYSYKEKLKQYYFTSINVRLGNALEEIVKEFLISNGAVFINRKQSGYDCDQLFTYQDKTVLIEQKIRDDHDSSKKKGQVENFLQKKKILSKYPNLMCCSWFIDDSFYKNYTYYLNNLPNDELFYGAEIEQFLRVVFGDSRCDGFVDNLINYFIEYSSSLQEENVFSNVIVEYEKLTPKTLYELILDKRHHKDIGECFFGGDFPYEAIYKDLQQRRRTQYTTKSLELLKEYV